MKVTREKTENKQAFLTIEMEPDEIEASLEDSYQRLVKKTRVPGFRKGKAPRAVLENYLGKESLLEEALKNLIPKAYGDAVKEQNIEAVARPDIKLVQTEPVIFKAVVPLSPTVELGDYHNIKVTPEPVEIAEDEVNAAIERLRHQEATWEPVERPVDFGDLVALDIESNIEGRPFINQNGIQYQVLRDISYPAPGFAEQLCGMKKDEEREFQLQYPSDHPQSDLAGKEPWFKVRVTEIKQEKLPELNDEFAREVGSDLETLDALRERVSTNLRLKAEEKAKADFEERVIDAAVEVSQVEFPPVLVEVEIDRLISQQARRWQMDDKSFEAYLKSINKTKEALREELRPIATKRVTQSLALDKIAEEEKIEVGDDEIETEKERMTKGMDEDRRNELQGFFQSSEVRESIRRTLITQKTVQRLAEIARGLAEK